MGGERLFVRVLEPMWEVCFAAQIIKHIWKARGPAK